jgi:L-seryl-tRNA(Ser) seleniumtransferase
MPNILRKIPTVGELLDSPPLKHLSDTVSRNFVVTGVRKFLDNMREEVRAKTGELHLPTPSELAQRIASWIMSAEGPALRPVINATGILLPEDLGRAPLAREALDEIATMAGGYASVELDLATGERVPRSATVEALLRDATGAEAALVVNNNAAATLVTLAALAAGREVIVARGEIVEIGGSYRLPEIMAASGAALCEVGMTNRTTLENYEQAIGDDTAALLRVVASEVATSSSGGAVPLAELVALARRRKLPVIDDLGGGALVDLSRYGLTGEPVVGESLRAGADLVLFSGDKLLGGPQCGIIVGRRDLVAKIAQHPLARALRVDKLALAALAATLRLYRNPESAEHAVPLLSLLSTPIENLESRARRLAPQMAVCPEIAAATPIAGQAPASASSPGMRSLPTWCIALTPKSGSVEVLAKALRTGAPAVLGRIEDQQLWLDLRSVSPSLDLLLVEAILQLGGSHEPAVGEAATTTTAGAAI